MWRLVVPLVASLLAAGVFFAVARHVAGREYSDALRPVGRAYALWWAMAGLMATTDVGRLATGFQPEPSVPVYLTLAIVKITATSAAIYGLGVYVLVLWTGRQQLSRFLAAFSLGHAGLFVYLFAKNLPADVIVEGWTTRLVLQGAGAGISVPAPAQALVFFLPVLALAVAYLSLWPRLQGRAQRQRVLAVASAVLVYMGLSSIQFNPDTPGDSPVIPVLALLTAGVAGLTAYAFFRVREEPTDGASL